jgi:tetratricopeptide (TPR) repeat protein
VLVAAGVLAYGNSLSNGFVFDDRLTVLNNEQIRTLLSPSVLWPALELPVAGRPVVNLSLAINYAVGGVEPAGYHAVNIALHVVCALLLFGLVRRTVRLWPGRSGVLGSHPESAALAVAILWVVHPLNSEVVNYVTQRTESVMAACYLLTLYAGVRAHQGAPALWSAIAVAACALGMASKESMVTAPAVLVLFDRVFAYDSFAAAWRARWRLYVGLAATWLVLAAILAMGPRTRSAGFTSGASPWNYFLNQAPLVLRYIRLSVWPDPLIANYGAPEPMSVGAAAPALSLLLALAAATLWALRWSPSAGFLAACVFVTLAPTSSIVPIATEVGAERRMYLPLAALAVLGVSVAVRLWTRAAPRAWRIGRPAALAAALALVVAAAALTARTLARNRDYATGLTLAQVTADRRPSPSAHHVLGEYLLAAGRRDEAIARLRLAIPGASYASYTLGQALFDAGRLDEAVEQFRSFVAREPDTLHAIEAHAYLGKALAARGDWAGAAVEFEAVLRRRPDDVVASYALADVLAAGGRFDDAIPHYRRYVAARPEDAVGLNQLGRALASAGRLREALAAFQQAEAQDGADGGIQNNLAGVYVQLEDAPRALVHARRAVELQPENQDARLLLEALERLAPSPRAPASSAP